MGNVLIIGSSGQIGMALTMALRARQDRVLTADIKGGADIDLDALDVTALKFTLQQYRIDEVYLLAAMLSATGEQKPLAAWNINTQSLLNVLELARMGYIKKVFWPSSIAVFNTNCELEPSTMYGISKLAGEKLCNYYHKRYNVDVRSLRYPGLISYDSLPGGGTTDYAVHIYHAALEGNYYNCFLKADTMLPMMYMRDAIRATLQVMDAPPDAVRQRTAYSIAGTSFTPAQIAACIKQYLPKFLMDYEPDVRQAIADNWPGEIDDTDAWLDWGCVGKCSLDEMTKDMLHQLHTKKQVPT